MRDVIQHRPDVAQLFTAGQAKVTIQWEMDSVPCKCRPTTVPNYNQDGNHSFGDRLSRLEARFRRRVYRPIRARIAIRLAGPRVGAFWRPGNPAWISLPGPAWLGAVNLPFSIVKTRTGYRASLSLPNQGQSRDFEIGSIGGKTQNRGGEPSWVNR